jgi:hypothetical protein
VFLLCGFLFLQSSIHYICCQLLCPIHSLKGGFLSS